MLQQHVGKGTGQTPDARIKGVGKKLEMETDNIAAKHWEETFSSSKWSWLAHSPAARPHSSCALFNSSQMQLSPV